MKLILCLPLFCAVGLWADEAQDRAAIDQAIAALNDPARRAGLFTKDADSRVDFDRLVDLHRRNSLSPCAVVGMDETWTELTVPRVVSGGIRFIAPDVAIVHGASIIRGAVTLARRVPLLFVMKKEGAEWRISAVRDSAPPQAAGTTDVRCGITNR
ncbi:MAG: hypothetical protein ABSB23_17845 [Bryobacteraceae bacterium]